MDLYIIEFEDYILTINLESEKIESFKSKNEAIEDAKEYAKYEISPGESLNITFCKMLKQNTVEYTLDLYEVEENE